MINVIKHNGKSDATPVSQVAEAQYIAVPVHTGYSKNEIDEMVSDFSEDKTTVLQPIQSLTNKIILRNTYNGSVKYDIVDTNNYNTYVFGVEEGQLIEMTQVGTGWGSTTVLAGAYYSSLTTLDNTTAVASAYKNADSRKTIGTNRELVPAGATALAITTHKNNTLTVSNLVFSPFGEVEDKLNNIVVPYNEWFKPFFTGQLAYTGNTFYVGINGNWVQINSNT